MIGFRLSSSTTTHLPWWVGQSSSYLGDSVCGRINWSDPRVIFSHQDEYLSEPLRPCGLCVRRAREFQNHRRTQLSEWFRNEVGVSA